MVLSGLSVVLDLTFASFVTNPMVLRYVDEGSHSNDHECIIVIQERCANSLGFPSAKSVRHS